jgi:hypothetical protein
MLAVLEDAVLVYQRYALARDPEKRQERKEAGDWIESADVTWPFSFENICNVLGIDPEYVRNGLRATDVRGRSATLTPREPRIIPLLARRESCGRITSETKEKETDLQIAS